LSIKVKHGQNGSMIMCIQFKALSKRIYNLSKGYLIMPERERELGVWKQDLYWNSV